MMQHGQPTIKINKSIFYFLNELSILSVRYDAPSLPNCFPSFRHEAVVSKLNLKTDLGPTWNDLQFIKML